MTPMSPMAPHVYIEGLGICVESLFEFDISTHDHLNRIAMVSYSKSAGIWSACRIGIAGRDRHGDWYAIKLSDIRLLADNLRVNRHSNKANRDYLNYCQLLQYHKELH